MARIRISKLAKDLNLNISAIFEFLRGNNIGFEDNNPNARIDAEIADRIIQRFNPDISRNLRTDAERLHKTCGSSSDTVENVEPVEEQGDNKELDVFISYSRKDTAVADEITQALDAAGISYFIDRQGISGGLEFPEILAQAIVECKVFLYLASKNSYQSKFTNSEITFAFNKKEKNRILPYITDDSELPIGLQFLFSGINWRNRTQHPISTLVADLRTMLSLPVRSVSTK